LNKPTRHQRKRAKGWKKPEGAVIVTRPSKYGNMYKVVRTGPSEWQVIRVGTKTSPVIRYGWTYDTERAALDDCLRYFRGVVTISPAWKAYLEELRGKDLVCWCKPDEPCHADVLIELANT
jgi:hypothetical protein